MTAKKKAKKKQPESEQAARNKKTPIKKATKKKITLKGQISKKKPASKAAHKKVAGKRSKMTTRKPIRETSRTAETVGFSSKGPTAREGGQSGDLQGLSNLEAADSESVVELLEEGNAFEAAAVAGVENAGNEPSEVRTHEVLEDDVPREYLDSE